MIYNGILMGFVLLFAMYCSIVLIVARHEHIGLRLAAVVALLSSLALFFQRDTYLPFLGRTALPPSVFQTTFSPVDSNVETDIVVDAPDNSKILYWGAAPEDGSNKVVSNPMKAYGTYENTGISIVRRGVAKIRFFCPVKYEVPWGKTLRRHIHYRIIDGSGMIGPVRTVYVVC